MDKSEIIERLEEIAKHAVHTVGEEPFIMTLDDGIAVHEAIELLQQSQPERETGTWIIDDEYPQHCWCSGCNNFFSLFDPKSIHFCPNCGREMKKCIWKSERKEDLT